GSWTGRPARRRQCPSPHRTGRGYCRHCPKDPAFPVPWDQSAAVSSFFPCSKVVGNRGPPFSAPGRPGYRGLFLGRETGGQILGNGVEFGIRRLGAVVGHLVDQILPALGIQVLL